VFILKLVVTKSNSSEMKGLAKGSPFPEGSILHPGRNTIGNNKKKNNISHDLPPVIKDNIFLAIRVFS
jgi:hypothetical protein